MVNMAGADMGRGKRRHVVMCIQIVLRHRDKTGITYVRQTSYILLQFFFCRAAPRI
jgi:hypothetical protein